MAIQLENIMYGNILNFHACGVMFHTNNFSFMLNFAVL